MKYSYNKEIRIAFYMLVGVMLVFSIIALYFNVVFGILMFINDLCLCALFFRFTNRRYRDIQKLSTELQSVYEGNYDFHINEYEEGELNILKSDIFKLTQILRQQKDVVIKDRSFLADNLSNISHQLKTPLTSMLVMCELLKDDELPENKRKQFLLQMQNQLERIEWLVTTLLKISKIDANAIVFDIKEHQVLNVLEESIEPFLISIELRQQVLQIQCPSEYHFCVDKNWTKEAIGNIVKNCMEHTPAEGRLDILAVDNPLYMMIEIRDNGIGIAKEDLPHIFKRFYRGKNAGKDSVGIGLALCSTVLHHQNASVEVHSTVKKGTCFQLRFYKS